MPKVPDVQPTRPLVLVVDEDMTFGLIVAACLDFEGADVVLAGSLAEARGSLRSGLHGVVLNRRLPDGDGLDLLDDIAKSCPGAQLVLSFTADEEAESADVERANLERVDKADLARLTEVLGLEPKHEHLPADRLLHISALDLDDGGGM